MLTDEEIITKKFEAVKKDLTTFKDAFVIRDSTTYFNSKFNEKSNPREWISKFMKLLSNAHSSFIDDNISNDSKVLLKMVPQANSHNEWVICISYLFDRDMESLNPKLRTYGKLMAITRILEERITMYLLHDFNLVLLLKQINKDEKEDIINIGGIKTLHQLYHALLSNDKLHDSFIRLWYAMFEINEMNEEFDYKTQTLDYSFLDWHCVVNEMTREFMDLMGRYDEKPISKERYYQRKADLYKAMVYYTRLLRTKDLKPENIYFIIKFLSKQGPDALLSLRNISDEVKFFVPLENSAAAFALTVVSNKKNSFKCKKLHKDVETKKRKV